MPVRFVEIVDVKTEASTTLNSLRDRLASTLNLTSAVELSFTELATLNELQNLATLVNISAISGLSDLVDLIDPNLTGVANVPPAPIGVARMLIITGLVLLVTREFAVRFKVSLLLKRVGINQR